MNSFAHYAFGAVGEWMFKVAAGIDTDGPGFEKIIIHPRPGGRLCTVRAAHTTIRGPVAVEWKRTGRAFRMEVTIPANTTATVFVPAAAGAAVTESGRPAARAAGVKAVGRDGDAAVYRVGSGIYRFASKI
ncbi:MAG: alpha-L-rhamnosidase C-terminal domain-containing protein [Planctomycetota bacterium]